MYHITLEFDKPAKYYENNSNSLDKFIPAIIRRLN